jgi:hypothetical protein
LKTKIKKPITREQDTVRGILDLLRLYKLKPIHIRNTGIIFTDKLGNKRFGKTVDGQRGAPDIVFSYESRAVALEVKSSVGKQSPEQKLWESDWTSTPCLGYYFVVKEITEVQNILENLKKKYGA